MTGGPVPIPTDTELMEQVRRADPSALATLYDRHADRLVAVGRRILRDDAAVQDVVHDVFLAAWHDAARFDPNRGSVRTWLCVRMRSRCLDRIRRNAVRTRHARSTPETAVTPAPDPTLLDLSLLDGLLDALPDTQRQAVQLRYLDGLSSHDAAQKAGCPVGTLKSRLRAGLSALRTAVDTGDRS